ncbi:hypothetical protein [Ideonella paludis]|uniref:Uncharacterized protein n=1 Tax=Ideonella paludis TaxID=1233411 RepID=A0ABS5DRE1_9BURK|nr:hypothetical protein [Ideonella paludis]MBQ0933706.1 hypothetical protein [Ideonella paludis]
MSILPFNEPILGGANGNLKGFAAGGWSCEEGTADFTWTEALEAKLQFNARVTSSPIHLSLVGFPYLADGQIKRQLVWVHLNGMYCGAFEATDRFEVALPIRSSWLEPRDNTITFTFPQAVAPAALGLGADQRLLGVGMYSIELRTG